VNFTYKGHEITITSVEIERDNWISDISIVWTEKNISTVRPCTLMRRFKKRDEAEEYALALVKKWIDQGKPNPPLPPGNR
jgi:hypothetical protein